MVVESKKNHGVLPRPGFESLTDHCFLPAGGPGDEHPFSRFRGEQHLFALLILIKNMLLISELLV